MVEIFIRSLLVGYSGAIMPGPLFTYAIDKSIKHGSIAGLLISVGHCILEFFIVMLLLLGLSTFLGTEISRAIIGAAGGVVLVYLALLMIRDAVFNKINVNFTKAAASVKYGNMLFSGAVISALNPGFIFWWAVVGLGLTMSAYTAFGLSGVVVFYSGHILSDITWYCFLSALVSKTRTFINIKIYKGIIIFLALFLLVMAFSFIYGSLKYFFRL